MNSVRKRALAVLLAVLMLIPAMGTMVVSAASTDAISEAEGMANPATASNDYAVENVDVEEDSATDTESVIASIDIAPIYLNAWNDSYQSEYWSDELNEWRYFTCYDWNGKLKGVVTFTDGTTGVLEDSRVKYNGEYHYVSCFDYQSGDNEWAVGGTYIGTVTVLGYTAEVEISVCEQNSFDNFEYLEFSDGIIITGVNGYGDVLTIPDTINDKPVIAITYLSGYGEIIIPDSVTTLSQDMFGYNWRLEKVTIGAGVKTLTNSMFEDIENLTEIIVSENNENYVSIDGIVYDKDVTTMVAVPLGKTTTHTVPTTVSNIDIYMNDSYDFRIILQNDVTGYIMENGILYNGDKTIVYYCTSDTTGNYIMPETVETIKPMAFYMSNLESVAVSPQVTDIAYYSFNSCPNLKKVVLPDNLTSISRNAFANCEQLSDVSLPSGLTLIEESAFENTGVKTITIPGGVKYVGDRAFSYSALENLTISNGVEEIGDYTFRNTKVKTVSIPSSVHTIGGSAFESTPLQSVSFVNGLEEILWSAFSDTELASVVFPESLTYIGGYAFSNSKLTSLYVPSNVTYVGSAAFDGCPIKTFTLAEGHTTTYSYAFRNIAIESLTLPQSITTVAHYSFADCENLANIDLPDNLQSICGHAFDNTAWLNNYPNGVVYLEQALYGYKGDMPEGTKVNVKSNIKLVADHAFNDEGNLTSIVLPSGLKTIGTDAFAYCDSLTGITIPDSVTALGEDAFYYCTSMKNATIGNSVTEIGDYTFFGCENLANVTIGNSVTRIAYQAFAGCDSLTNVELPNSLESIDGYAFYDCDNLASVYIPDSVKTMGRAVFYGCENLTDIYCEAESEPAGWEYYWAGNSNATIHWGHKLTAKITKQPVSVVAPNGSTAKVSLTASGYGLTYKWYYKNKGDSKFTLTNSFKSNSYSVTMDSSRAGRQVYCVITDKYGNSVKTNTVTLGMAAKITKQPVSIIVSNGKTAKVTVTASGEGLKYQWYFKDKGNDKFYLTNSFTSNTYSVTMNATRASRQVYCKITDKYGNSVTTNVVTLHIKPTITKQPKTVAVQSGKQAKVTVSAVGTGLTYKWYYKDKGASKFALTNSFKGDSYYIEMNGTRAGRQVYCVITDKYGNSVKTNTVTLGMAVKITKQPTSVTVANGKTAKVTVSASGEGRTYKWYFKDKGSSKFYLTTSFTGSTYSVTMNNARAGRQVYCIITDKYGNSVKTNTVTLNKR